MATSGRGTGMVGYNLQTAVDTTHHLIVAHEVTNIGNDRSQLANMSEQARERLAWRSWLSLQTADISVATKSWLATRLVSQHTSPSH
jgi:hypothetical protein